MTAKRNHPGHPLFLCCMEHRSFMAWCDECVEILRLYQSGVRPQTMNHPKSRTDDEAEQVAATVEELQGADLEAMARRCEQLLAANYGDTIKVRPED